MRIIKYIILLLVLNAFIFTERAQSQRITTSDYNSWSVGAKYGILYFYGDVREMKYSNDNPYKKTNTGFAFDVTKNFNHIFGAKLQFLTGNLSGSSPNLNLHFKSNIDELSILGVVNLNDLISFYPRKAKFLNAYIFAGFGMLGYRSVVRTYNEDAYIASYGWDSAGAKTKLQNALVFPFGIGIKIKADAKFDVGLEFTLHLTKTDNLDAWAVKNSYNDRYSYLAVSLTYKIGCKKEYVDWVNPMQDTTKNELLYANYTETKQKENIQVNNNSDKNTKPITQNKTENNTKANKTTVTDSSKNKATTNKTVIKNKPDTTTSKKVNVSNNNVSSNNNTIKKNSTTVKTDTTAKAIKTNTFTQSDKKYFIIAGIYPSEQQANAEVEALKSKGFEDAEVMGKNEYGNWRVCYKGYATKDEATQDLTQIQQLGISSAWIYEKPSVTISKTNNVSTSNNTVKEPVIIIMKDTTTKTIQTNNTAVSTITNNVVKKYFIIAGSYTTEQQANDAVDVLKSKGYKDAEVVGKNDYGNWRICYKGYADKDEAVKDLSIIKQSGISSAWLFEKK